MKQKFQKMVMMLMMLSILSIVSCNSVATTSIIEFSDVPKEYWAYQSIMKMTENGLFKGTSEPVDGVGTFSPERIITRAEFITVSLRIIYPKDVQAIEKDNEQWWRAYYVFALEKGIIKHAELGYGDLDQPMTREEMAMIMVRCVEKNGEKLTQKIATSQIQDYSQIGEYYKEYVRDCYSFGLICGVDQKGTFAPTKSLTRAEAATLLCRLLDKDMRVEVEFEEDIIVSSTPETELSNVPEVEKSEQFPWENGGKQPEDYTWEEYLALTGTQAEAFYESFESVEEFNKWLKKAQGKESKFPWENGGKQPAEYTWEEYQALPDSQKDAFYESFESVEEFDKWLKIVQGKESRLPWENDGKQPVEYTWEEYQSLADSQKDAFFESFESVEEFDKWMKKAQGKESSFPWENGGKQPAEYTWEEYQALPDSQKDAFFESFENIDDFDKWLTTNQP